MTRIAWPLVWLVALPCGCPQDAPPCAETFAAAFPVGTVPNDVAFAECDGEPVVLVPASGAARLDVLTLPCGAARAGVLFPPERSTPASPWAVAADGARAWVTLQGQGAVALVDPCTGTVLDVARPTATIELDPPLHLSAPQDADDDGTTELEVGRLLPRAPQPVVAQDGVAFVAYTNLLEPGISLERPPVLGPGVLARFQLIDDVIAPEPLVATLPCANPQGLALHDGALWVSCSGPLGPTADAAVAALGDGALLRIDPASLAVLEAVDVGRFAPGTPALMPDALVVGSLLRPALARVAGGALVETAVAGAALESIFECARLDTGAGPRALCTHFSGDRLLVVEDGAAGLTVVRELPVGSGDAVFRGAQAVAIAPPAARARGVGAAVLLGLSAEVVLIRSEDLP